MSSQADYMVDRRRLRRRVTLWRVIAFAVAAVAIIGVALLAGGSRMALSGLNHVAKVEISGFITGDDKTLELLENVGKSRAQGVLVIIDSPGGTVTGSERLYDGLRQLSAKKPTVAVVRGLAASGGYIAAMGADRIVAQQTSLVGSIGVLFQYPNVVRLLDTVGVKMETVKSAPLKASPNPFEPTTPESEAAVKALVADSYGWFTKLVSDRRGLSGDPLKTVADGRVFTGHQGVGLKLVDEIGSEKQAVAWLERERGVAKDLPVREWKRRDGTTFGLWSAGASTAGLLGFEQVAGFLQAAARAGDQPAIEGLLAVWRP